MYRNMVKIVILIIIFSMTLDARRGDKKPPVDHMAVATMMLYDGNYKMMADELNLVDTKKSNFDFSKYYTLYGMMSMKTNNYNKAVDNFHSAIDSTKTKIYKAPSHKKDKFTLYKYFFKNSKNISDKPKFDSEALRAMNIGKLYLYISEAYYKMKDYKKAIINLDLALNEGRKNPKLYIYKSDCYWKLKEYSNAFKVLNSGAAKFKEDKTILKQKFYYFVDLGMFQRAIEVSSDYLLAKRPTVRDYTLFAQILAKSNQITKAIKITEEAKLRFPQDAATGVLLAHLYLKEYKNFSAANLFEVSSYYENKYSKEASEMFRRVGENAHTIYLISQIADKKEMIKQKIALYVSRGEFLKIIGMKKALSRYNLLEDENLRYALAYSYFMQKDYKKSEYHLKKLTKSELFSKATVIRKNIENCLNSNLECI